MSEILNGDTPSDPEILREVVDTLRRWMKEEYPSAFTPEHKSDWCRKIEELPISNNYDWFLPKIEALGPAAQDSLLDQFRWQYLVAVLEKARYKKTQQGILQAEREEPGGGESAAEEPAEEESDTEPSDDLPAIPSKDRAFILKEFWKLSIGPHIAKAACRAMEGHRGLSRPVRRSIDAISLLTRGWRNLTGRIKHVVATLMGLFGPRAAVKFMKQCADMNSSTKVIVLVATTLLLPPLAALILLLFLALIALRPLRVLRPIFGDEVVEQLEELLPW